jgi:hypothetical protein
VVCDVTSTQSKYRDCFAADVKSALDDPAVTSPEVCDEHNSDIHYIARAEIVNRFDYFVRPRLLLLGVDYEHRDSDLRTSMKRDIAEAVTRAHLQSEEECDL